MQVRGMIGREGHVSIGRQCQNRVYEKGREHEKGEGA